MAHPPDDADERISFSCYPKDVTFLRQLVLGLAQRGVKVKRTIVVRALAHILPESGILARAILQYEKEPPLRGRGNVGGEHTAKRLTPHILKSDLEKFDRVSNEMLAKDMDVNRSYLLRAVLNDVTDLDAFAEEVRKFTKEFPDKRSRAGLARKSKKQKNA